MNEWMNRMNEWNQDTHRRRRRRKNSVNHWKRVLPLQLDEKSKIAKPKCFTICRHIKWLLLLSVINFVSSLASIVKSFFHLSLWSFVLKKMFLFTLVMCFVSLFFSWSLYFPSSFILLLFLCIYLYLCLCVCFFFLCNFFFVSKQKKHLIDCGWMEE